MKNCRDRLFRQFFFGFRVKNRRYFFHTDPIILFTYGGLFFYFRINITVSGQIIGADASETQAAGSFGKSCGIGVRRFEIREQPVCGLIIGRIGKFVRVRTVFQFMYCGSSIVREEALIFRGIRQMQVVQRGGFLAFGVSDDAAEPLDALPFHGGAGEDDADGGIRDIASLVQGAAGDENPQLAVPETVQGVLVRCRCHLGMTTADLVRNALLQESVELVCLADALAEDQDPAVRRQQGYQLTGAQDTGRGHAYEALSFVGKRHVGGGCSGDPGIFVSGEGAQQFEKLLRGLAFDGGAGSEQLSVEAVHLFAELLIFCAFGGLEIEADVENVVGADRVHTCGLPDAVAVDRASQNGGKIMLRCAGGERRGQSEREKAVLVGSGIRQKLKDQAVLAALVPMAFIRDQQDREPAPEIGQNLSRQSIPGGVDHIDHIFAAGGVISGSLHSDLAAEILSAISGSGKKAFQRTFPLAHQRAGGNHNFHSKLLSKLLFKPRSGCQGEQGFAGAGGGLYYASAVVREPALQTFLLPGIERWDHFTVLLIG